MPDDGWRNSRKFSPPAETAGEDLTSETVSPEPGSGRLTPEGTLLPPEGWDGGELYPYPVVFPYRFEGQTPESTQEGFYLLYGLADEAGNIVTDPYFADFSIISADDGTRFLILTHYGTGTLDLSKPVLGTNDAPLRILSIGFDPSARMDPEFEHGKPHLVGSIRAVILPDTLVELGPGALMNCGNVTNVSLPASLRRIGPWAFSGCHGLRRILIPAGVEDVSDDRAFMGCTALESIDVEDGSEEFRSDNGVLLSRDGTRLVAYPPGRGGRYDVPEGIVAIPGHAFVNCHGLGEVSIPRSVTNIGQHAFADCTSLTNVIAAPGSRVELWNESFLDAPVRPRLPWRPVSL